MGRKVKKGLDYFPLYHDFFTSKKIKALRRAHGSVGILTYLNLLCKVYDRGYFYRFDGIDELAMDIAEEIANAQLRATATGVTETINYLVGQGILDEGLFKRGIISGVALQEQYVISSYKAKRKIEMDVFCLLQKNEEGVYVSGSTPEKNISSEEMPISTEEIPIYTEESTQRERRRENKIKDFFSFLSIAREQGQIVLSNKEVDILIKKISEEDLQHYVEAIITCERDGKKFKKKSHFQAIVDMAKEDDKYNKPQKSYDLDDFFEAALSKTMEELK
jgi:hypothetical protein